MQASQAASGESWDGADRESEKARRSDNTAETSGDQKKKQQRGRAQKLEEEEEGIPQESLEEEE